MSDATRAVAGGQMNRGRHDAGRLGVAVGDACGRRQSLSTQSRHTARIFCPARVILFVYLLPFVRTVSSSMLTPAVGWRWRASLFQLFCLYIINRMVFALPFTSMADEWTGRTGLDRRAC